MLLQSISAGRNADQYCLRCYCSPAQALCCLTSLTKASLLPPCGLRRRISKHVRQYSRGEIKKNQRDDGEIRLLADQRPKSPAYRPRRALTNCRHCWASSGTAGYHR